MNDIQKKVFFVQKDSSDGYQIESLWCTIFKNNFVIDNIPFVAKRVSLGDVISAEWDEDDQCYYFDDFISVSGNTTVRLFLQKEEDIKEVRDYLSSKNCESEIFLSQKTVAINIPKDVMYPPLKEYFEVGEESGKWVYEESCLAHKI
jgi:hypothetical protein